MKAAPGKFGAWLELARVSNAPTVVSNIVAGLAIGAALSGETIRPEVAVLLCLGGLLLYSGGMVLNDVLDARVDRAERPRRPIPSGRIARLHALAVAALMFVTGIAAVIPAGGRSALIGAALVVAIVVYNLIHHRTAVSVIVMGLCRALLYLVAACTFAGAAGQSRLIAPVAFVGAYTAAFSFVARQEAAARPAVRRVFAWAPLPLGVAIVAAVSRGGREYFTLIPLPILIFASIAAWRRPPNIRRAVLTWIATFALIDAAVCASLVRLDLAGVCLACFLVTVFSHRKIAGT